MKFLYIQKKKIKLIKKLIIKINNLRFTRSELTSDFINFCLNNLTKLPKVFYIDAINNFYQTSGLNIINFIKKKIILKHLKFNWLGLYNNYYAQFQIIPRKNDLNMVDTIFGFKISSKHKECYQYGFYVSEISETFLIMNIINKYENFIDIGAHLGFFTSLVASHKKKVFSFEPNPYCFEKIKKNKYIKKYNIGLGDKNDSKILNIINQPFVGGSTFSKAKSKIFCKVKSKIITLDQFSKKHKLQKKTLIKIDCESFENNVLKGGINYIKKYKPDFIIDIRDRTQFNTLKDNNYKIFPIIKDPEQNTFVLKEEMKNFYLSDSVQNAYCVNHNLKKEREIKIDLRLFCNPEILDDIIHDFAELK
jgi:FkbM family methyltransferase